MNPRPNAVSGGIFGFQGQRTRTVDYQEQRDLTQAELDSISASSKQSQAKTRSEKAKTKATASKLTRGATGGLKATAKTAPKILGTIGLGSSKGLLGAYTLAGETSKLG